MVSWQLTNNRGIRTDGQTEQGHWYHIMPTFAYFQHALISLNVPLHASVCNKVSESSCVVHDKPPTSRWFLPIFSGGRPGGPSISKCTDYSSGPRVVCDHTSRTSLVRSTPCLEFGLNWTGWNINNLRIIKFTRICSSSRSTPGQYCHTFIYILIRCKKHCISSAPLPGCDMNKRLYLYLWNKESAQHEIHLQQSCKLQVVTLKLWCQTCIGC